MTGEDVVAVARQALGAPFRVQGRDPSIGLDCVGLLVYVARTFNLSHQDKVSYSLSADMSRLPMELEQSSLRRLGCEDRRSGDVLLFQLRPGHWHVGIASPVGMIHAHLGLRRVVEHRLDAEWLSALVAVYRFNLSEH